MTFSHSLNLSSKNLSSLKREFSWMLNTVADYLSKNDCLKIAHAEQLTLINPDSEEFQLTLLLTLQGKGLFGPLNPDGLIEILKRINRNDAVCEVTQYESEYRCKIEKECHKLKKQAIKKDEDHGVNLPENMEEIDKLLTAAKAKMYSQIKALESWESSVEKYRAGAVSLMEVNKLCTKYSERVERSANIFRGDLTVSESSLTSCSSSDPAEDDSYLEARDSWYQSEASAPLAPIQETVQQQSPDLSNKPITPPSTKHCQSLSSSRTLKTTIPTPSTSLSRASTQTGVHNIKTTIPTPSIPQSQASTQTGVLIKRPLPAIPALVQRRETDTPTGTYCIVYDEDDFTGGTGDSGVGTGESNRLKWIGSTDNVNTPQGTKLDPEDTGYEYVCPVPPNSTCTMAPLNNY